MNEVVRAIVKELMDSNGSEPKEMAKQDEKNETKTRSKSNCIMF